MQDPEAALKALEGMGLQGRRVRPHSNFCAVAVETSCPPCLQGEVLRMLVPLLAGKGCEVHFVIPAGEGCRTGGTTG